jgi:hypothetical protein
MSSIVDRQILLQASWTNTIRLARWIGAKRLPTCGCPECRAVVVGALERYLRRRSWTTGDALDRGIDSASRGLSRSSKKRTSRAASAHARGF